MLPGQRVFDVAVQGTTVLKGLDIVREAGGRNRALVKEFTDVEASEQIGAGKYERSSERQTQRNGYRGRRWETRVGDRKSGWGGKGVA